MFRREYGRAVAVLVRRFGDIDLAEEAVQDAFAVAVERWPRTGLPPSPAGWIITTARNRAVDRLRREAVPRRPPAQAALLRAADDAAAEEGPVRDDRLRLIFTCCHPGAGPGGPGRADAAAARRPDHRRDRPRVPGPRADHGPAPGPRQAQDPRRAHPVPGAARRPICPTGCGAVLAVVYLIFNEGYTASSGERPGPADLCAEAIRLGRLLAELMPDEPEALGLLALMLLAESRRPARTDAAANLVLLADQDRGRWDRGLIAEGQALVRRCLRRDRPGPYQIQAAISAVHSDAADRRRHGLAADPGTVRPAHGRRADSGGGPEPRGRGRRDRGPAGRARPGGRRSTCDGYHVYHAVRADLLRRLGRNAEAADAYERAAGPHRQRRRAGLPAPCSRHPARSRIAPGLVTSRLTAGRPVGRQPRRPRAGRRHGLPGLRVFGASRPAASSAGAFSSRHSPSETTSVSSPRTRTAESSSMA